MPDLHKATWQNVQEELADELDSIQGHFFDLIVVLRISPAEAHATVLQAQQSSIRNRHSMRISRQVPQDLLRPAERGLGVSHPFLLTQGRYQILKTDWMCELAKLSMELQATFSKRLF